MDRIADAAGMTAQALAWRREGLRIGLVPTMGYLHRGHTSLMEALRPRCDRLVVSIFVNPLQFGPTEDLARYPRDLDGDLRACAAAGVDAVLAPPDPTGFYPSDFSTRVAVSGLTDGLCGASRPTHFEGVTTVVARLFGVTRADLAIFGEKDWQQLMVIRRMARDLALPVQIVPGPLVRDDDGLALSSRNVYLSPAERARALSLSRALGAMRDAADAGARDAATLLARGRALLDVDRLDYLELVDAVALTPVTTVDRPCRALVAAFLGRTRLIDNVAVGGEPDWGKRVSTTLLGIVIAAILLNHLVLWIPPIARSDAAFYTIQAVQVGFCLAVLFGLVPGLQLMPSLQWMLGVLFAYHAVQNQLRRPTILRRAYGPPDDAPETPHDDAPT